MAKLKLTRVELKRQKDALGRFERYLPTLMLKKQQLQVEIRRVERDLDDRLQEMEGMLREIRGWAGLVAGKSDLAALLELQAKRIRTGNIAGVDIPVFEGVDFTVQEYDLYATPLWTDAAVEALQRYAALGVEREVLERQRDALSHELRITTQRVNLFEKVKIPEAKENIRSIRIFLGDQQTAAVVRGKISKAKLTEGSEETIAPEGVAS